MASSQKREVHGHEMKVNGSSVGISPGVASVLANRNWSVRN